MEKNAWLNQFFMVPYENRIFIQQGEDKVEIIDFYLKQVMGVEPKGNAILIDDSEENIDSCKDVDNITAILTYWGYAKSPQNGKNEDEVLKIIQERL